MCEDEEEGSGGTGGQAANRTFSGQRGATAGLEAGECRDENDCNSDRADGSLFLWVFIAALPRCRSPPSGACFTDVI